MRQDFVTRLELELRAAAERQAAPHRLPALRLGRFVPALVALAVVAVAAVLVVRALPRDEETVPAQEPPRLVAHQQLASQGGPAISAFGSAWVSDLGGDVLRVDPRTRKVVARVPVGGGAALASGDGVVYAVADGRLQLIDPQSNRVVRTIAMGRRSGSVGMAGGAPWVGGPDGTWRVDVARGTVGPVIPVNHGAFQAVGANTDGRTIYVLRADGSLLRLDGRTGKRLAPIRADAAGPIDAVGDGRLYVALDDAEVALDAATGRQVWRRELGAQSVNNATLDGPTLWVHATDRATNRDRLWRLDARTGTVSGALTLPAFGAPGMTTVGGRPWVISLDGELMEAR
jgi:outer membrane protein assembly factor BamB